MGFLSPAAHTQPGFERSWEQVTAVSGWGGEAGRSERGAGQDGGCWKSQWQGEPCASG